MMVRLAVQHVAAALACAGGIYSLLNLLSARSFANLRPIAPTTFTPPVSILKPVRGADPQAYESFRSHCLLDYPDYEVIFGVADAEDPVLPLIEGLMREFPDRKVRWVLCPESLGLNRKVSNLLQMLPHAKHPYLLINDADIEVAHDYLRRVMAPLADDRIGLVTCLYSGIPASSLGSRLESLGISSDFMPGVLMARWLEGGLRFALGSTMVLSRDVLEKSGGFGPLADCLADDYQLGLRVAAAGKQIRLSDVAVETHLPAYSLGEFFAHQLRWARGNRASRPWGYAGLPLTFGFFWSLVVLLAARGASWAWIMMAIILLLRIAVVGRVGRDLLRDRSLSRNIWLLPLRDFLSAVIWAASYGGRTVTWRGDRFQISGGKLQRA